MEAVLRDLEYFATLSSLHDQSYQYPRYVHPVSCGSTANLISNELDTIRSDVLLIQFYDILAGTSIKMLVLHDALAPAATSKAPPVLETALALSALLPRNPAMNGVTPGSTQAVVLVGPLRLPRQQVIAVGPTVTDAIGEPCQTLPVGTTLALNSTESNAVGTLIAPLGTSAPTAKLLRGAHSLPNAHFANHHLGRPHHQPLRPCSSEESLSNYGSKPII
jgi:hypothetical protein